MRNFKQLSLVTVSIAMALAFTTGQADARKRHIPGHSVRHQTKAETRAPGATKEIAPDSKQSATGGQPGGIPGR